MCIIDGDFVVVVVVVIAVVVLLLLLLGSKRQLSVSLLKVSVLLTQ